jgi:diketogulonate reductase-like aldo/keto reductase
MIPASRTTGTSVPRFLYGTAWKEGATQALTELAIQQGFRGIDTANQRKHYYEAAVGTAIASCIEKGLVTRDELFLQTKFTFRHGQDKRLPYDPAAPIEQQVAQSFASSLKHLGTDRIDSFILHGPSRGTGICSDDMAAWKAMEELHDSGKVCKLGISNVNFDQLAELFQRSRIRPMFVQNRCYAIQHWDRAIRLFCKDNGAVYQGFSLLTANRAIVSSPQLAAIAKRYARSPAQVVFRFAIQIGMLPLTGTSNVAHMRADLDVTEFSLTNAEIELIETLASRLMGASEQSAKPWT